MGAPVATSSDLQTYLGAPSIDSARATFILLLAQNLCEAILTPLPSTANAVVLAVAARAYVNASQAQSETAGSYNVQYGGSQYAGAVGGLYLSRSDKANLRRLKGGGGAFSIDTLPPGVAAVQLVTILGSPTGGTFTLTLGGQATTPIAFNAAASTVQTALWNLTTLGSGNTTVTGANGGPWTVTFAGALATTPVPTFTGDGSALTGGTSPLVQVSVVTQGVRAAGQGLPPWDLDYNNGGLGSQYVPGGWA